MKEAAQRRDVTANHLWQVAAFEYLRPPRVEPPKPGLVERFFDWLFGTPKP